MDVMYIRAIIAGIVALVCFLLICKIVKDNQ